MGKTSGDTSGEQDQHHKGAAGGAKAAAEGRRHGRGGGGGGGGGGGRRTRPNDSREVVVSKKLSYILRHGAAKEGLKLDEKGFVGVAELLQSRTLRSLKVTFEELRAIVATNAKQRFELAPRPAGGTIAITPSSNYTPEPSAHLPPDANLPVSGPDPSPSNLRVSRSVPSNDKQDDPKAFLIRATQGHSIKIESAALLTPILPADPACPSLVVHGTYPAAWRKILASGGLSRMGRTHVHFATGLIVQDSRAGRGGVSGSSDVGTADDKNRRYGSNSNPVREDEVRSGKDVAPGDDPVAGAIAPPPADHRSVADEEEERGGQHAGQSYSRSVKDISLSDDPAAGVAVPPKPASSPAPASARAELDAADAAAELGLSAPKPTPDAAAVISGMRSSATVLVWVNVRQSMADDGLKWWRSANGVVLTEGDEKGFVPLRFVDRVEERSKSGSEDAKVIWTVAELRKDGP